MIYMDNAATTLRKPVQVKEAVLAALDTMGNAGRGASDPALDAVSYTHLDVYKRQGMHRPCPVLRELSEYAEPDQRDGDLRCGRHPSGIRIPFGKQ